MHRCEVVHHSHRAREILDHKAIGSVTEMVESRRPDCDVVLTSRLEGSTLEFVEDCLFDNLHEEIRSRKYGRTIFILTQRPVATFSSKVVNPYSSACLIITLLLPSSSGRESMPR